MFTIVNYCLVIVNLRSLNRAKPEIQIKEPWRRHTVSGGRCLAAATGTRVKITFEPVRKSA